MAAAMLWSLPPAQQILILRELADTQKVEWVCVHARSCFGTLHSQAERPAVTRLCICV